MAASEIYERFLGCVAGVDDNVGKLVKYILKIIICMTLQSLYTLRIRDSF
jgi:hypothetical protein